MNTHAESSATHICWLTPSQIIWAITTFTYTFSQTIQTQPINGAHFSKMFKGKVGQLSYVLGNASRMPSQISGSPRESLDVFEIWLGLLQIFKPCRDKNLTPVIQKQLADTEISRHSQSINWYSYWLTTIDINEILK